uniref:Uncharacterized protein LOC105645113 isoform X1 n=1 Tax=Rhizophora mucronata TaxID=61149 RepID=A0A2P2L3X3_RHIMU
MLFDLMIITVLNFHYLRSSNCLNPKINLHLLQLFSLSANTMNSLLQNVIT